MLKKLNLNQTLIKKKKKQIAVSVIKAREMRYAVLGLATNEQDKSRTVPQAHSRTRAAGEWHSRGFLCTVHSSKVRSPSTNSNSTAVRSPAHSVVACDQIWGDYG